MDSGICTEKEGSSEMALYLEDFKPGMKFKTPTRTVTETDILLFSAMSGDFNELHTSETFAYNTPFQRRIMQGLLGLSISHGLLFRLGLLDGTGLAFLEVDSWKFKNPVFIGDTLFAEIEVHESRRSKSRPTTGIVTFLVRLKKVDDTVTQEGLQIVMVRSRHGETE